MFFFLSVNQKAMAESTDDTAQLAEQYKSLANELEKQVKVCIAVPT